MDRSEYLRRYWSYYLKLEQDCVELTQYVEFCDRNYNTFSNVIISQLLNVGAEFDYFCKVVCELNPEEHHNIHDYYVGLTKKIPDIKQFKLRLPFHSIELSPFHDWKENCPSKLFWWSAYNNVKHNRAQHIEDGNLYNLLNALAALFFSKCISAEK